jgi:hypothetical protein
MGHAPLLRTARRPGAHAPTLDEAKAKLEEIVVLSGTLTATLPRRRL